LTAGEAAAPEEPGCEGDALAGPSGSRSVSSDSAGRGSGGGPSLTGTAAGGINGFVSSGIRCGGAAACLAGEGVAAGGCTAGFVVMGAVATEVALGGGEAGSSGVGGPMLATGAGSAAVAEAANSIAAPTQPSSAGTRRLIGFEMGEPLIAASFPGR